MIETLQAVIEQSFDERDGISPATQGEVRDAVAAQVLLQSYLDAQR